MLKLLPLYVLLGMAKPHLIYGDILSTQLSTWDVTESEHL